MNIVLTGGGTAGHIIPNLALIDELKQYFDNIYYIGSDKDNEKKLVENYGIPYYPISTPKLIRKFTTKNFCIPFLLIKSIKSCKKLLQKLKPDLVFSKGGYVSLPVVIAAHRLGIKVVVHESDTSMGLANRICSRFSNKVCTTFPIYKNKTKYICTGAPIRKEFFHPSKKEYFKNSRSTILFVGGSQGAATINNFVYDNLDTLTKKYNVIHICGANKLIPKEKQNYIQMEFCDEMPTLINSCDLVITRGGSNALFEILAVGKPMIIVPLSKKESRGEQIENANFFKQHNLATTMNSLEINALLHNIDTQLQNHNKIKSLQNSFISNAGSKNVVDVIINTIQTNK